MKLNVLGASVCGVVALSGALVGSSAHAYVRTRASGTNVALQWKSACLELRFLLGSAPAGVSEEYFRTAVGESAAQWSSSTLACTKMFITVSASAKKSVFVENDGANNVQFRSEFWGRNAKNPAEAVPYPPNALAITSVFADRNTGRVVDTDVEINALSAMWGDVVANPALLKSSNTHDLQNTLTHEFGHVVGLDHTCDGGGQSNMFDNENKRVPTCPGSAEIQETTMAAIVTPGDSLRRTLAPDDQKGVCEMYPADGRLACAAESGCEVASAHARDRSWSWAGLAGVLGLALLVRRRSRAKT